MRLTLRLVLIPTMVVLTSLMAAPTATFAQASQTTARAQWTAPSATDTPTSVRCTDAGHQDPCWAFTQRDSLGAPWCPTNPESHTSAVPLFSSSGGLNACLASPDLVEISCYYQGQPVAYGDNFEDHVIKEYSGGLSIVGHIPDFFVNLGNNNPPNVGIPLC